MPRFSNPFSSTPSGGVDGYSPQFLSGGVVVPQQISGLDGPITQAFANLGKALTGPSPLQQQMYQTLAAKQQAEADKATFDLQQAKDKQAGQAAYGSSIAKLFAPTQMVDPSLQGPNLPTPSGAFVGPGEVPNTPDMMQAALREQAPGLVAQAVARGLDPAKAAEAFRASAALAGLDNSTVGSTFAAAGHAIQPNDAFTVPGQQALADQGQAYKLALQNNANAAHMALQNNANTAGMALQNNANAAHMARAQAQIGEQRYQFDNTPDAPDEIYNVLTADGQNMQTTDGVTDLRGNPLPGNSQLFKVGAPRATSAPAAPAPVASATAGLAGDDLLKALQPADAAQVQALAEGRQSFPSGAALRSPYWQNMLQTVAQYDPSFDATNYGVRAKVRADFTAGQSARQINAMNTVIGHLQSLSDAADALGNTDYTSVNAAKNWAAGETGQPQIKQFDANKKAVVDELTRVWRGNGGSEGDIKTWSEAIGSSNSPAQLHGVVGQIGDLIESKINSMGNQYRQGMGTKAGDVAFVTPQARQVLTTLQQRAGMGAPAGQQAPGQVASPAQPKVLRFDAQGNLIP